MHVHLLKSKIHRAEVTAASLDYEGSLTLAIDLMESVGLLPFERVLCSNLANGERFETYAIPGRRGSGDCILNGATAHLGKIGDRLTIAFEKTPLLTGTLEHWQHDTFVARWTDRELRADAFVTFALTPDGGIESARMRAVSPETDFSFDFQDLLFRPVSAAPR